ncbi:hypothetical protein HQ305_13270 [Rhodococcus sp. BP-149]|uniref:hypothetical protein n=1 Tax=unclassified Rhodococcus (in: high G+C Gram-positive bacteria) TaxID=192944 RepID=UPI001C9B6D38|nr:MULTISPECIES: hypothetical protein [unclassified Rhodococcus (in: high G+C Gram-positive bacteria)]MBY6686527.1 hypothetical protein [Rhodococcus sp. BP-288]MBY6695237.1 hypothetical protein [Rhodococcus sp. BP-188]MBY6700019.1 hypothetical protein [Rhodococcus sp. BP-285]MBY6704958.1 hypothetical protein [Rhodococcus sp. BP-283]MBY6713144.1 hypothetical protein [Rhodococcus sp. BP-160]
MAGLKFRVIASAGDQVLSSVSNAVILFAMAGPSSVQAFGAAVLVFSIVTAAIGLVRGALGTPLLLMSGESREDILREGSRGLGSALLFGAVVGVVALVVSIALDEPQVGIAYATAVPLVLAQDVLRFVSMALGEPESAFVSDAIWAVGAGAVLVTTWISPTALVIPEMIWFWSIAGGLALLQLAWRTGIRPTFRGLRTWWVEFWQHRTRFAFESGVDQIAAILIVSVSTIFIGTVAAASLRGAVTVLGPFAVLISSLPLIVIPEAVRAGHSAKQIWRTLSYAAWITSALAATIGFLAPFVPSFLGRLLLGDSWAEATQVLPFLGLEYAAICWIAGVYNFYRSRGASAELLKYRIVQSLLGIVICTGAAAIFRTAAGVAIGLALSATVMAVCLVVEVYRKQLRQVAAERRPVPATALAARGYAESRS